jgi:hypothetical protein
VSPLLVCPNKQSGPKGAKAGGDHPLSEEACHPDKGSPIDKISRGAKPDGERLRLDDQRRFP